MRNCPFCDLSDKQVVAENGLAVAFLDKYPVNQGHLLIIPKRHVQDYFAATAEEINAIHELINEAREYLDKEFRPDGYNIGVNIGAPAGQTVFHLHFHIIPRYTGDVDNPRGGVRNFKESIVPYPVPRNSEEQDGQVVIYNKLVRDKIPDIVSQAGKMPVTRIAAGEELAVLMKKKLMEEVLEYLNTGQPEELADILEVLRALAVGHDMSWSNVETEAFSKREKRGGFDNGVVLVKVEG